MGEMSPEQASTFRLAGPGSPAMADWESDLRVRLGYSPLHIRKSVAAVEAFGLFVGRALSTADLTRGNVLRWATSLIDPDRPGSRKTAQNRVSQLRAYCDYLVLSGAMEVNPIERLRMPGTRGRKAGAVHFTAEQMSALILAAEAREGRRPKYGPLASTFYGVLAMTGLRYGEAGDQRWEDVDLSAGRLVLTRDKARRNDALPLTGEAVAALREWRKWSTGALVFPQRPSHNTLTMDMEACGIAGVESGVKGQWHRFRKGAVRERAKAGATIRNLKHFARHSDVNETLRNYDHAGVEELRATAELMPRLNGFLGRSQTGGRDGGKEIVDEKSVRTEVDSRGEPSTLGVSKRRKVMPTLSAKPESPAAGRAGIDSRLDTGVDVSARLATNDSGMEPGGITLPSALAADFLEAVARHLRGGA